MNYLVLKEITAEISLDILLYHVLAIASVKLERFKRDTRLISRYLRGIVYRAVKGPRRFKQKLSAVFKLEYSACGILNVELIVLNLRACPIISRGNLTGNRIDLGSSR